MLQERLEYDVQDIGDDASLDLSIVCPFYNEAERLFRAERSGSASSFARPKSRSFTCWSLRTMTFSGFKSRWITFRE